MAFGLTDAGFRKKRLADIKAEIEDTLRSRFGNQINLLPESVFGQLVGISAERESLLWELMEAVYSSQYPDSATGNNLDLVASLTGITRLQATRSTVAGQLLFGTVGTLVPQGTQFSVQGSPSSVFETLSDVTLVAGADEVQDITFDLVPDAGAFVLDFGGQTTSSLAFNATDGQVQAALEALGNIGSGNVAVSGDFSVGFTITFQDELQKQPITDLIVDSNTLVQGATPVVITVTETTAGVIQGEVDMQATQTGPIVAPERSLNVIDTTVSGLDQTINPNDAIVGRNRETDSELRTRRENEIQTAGAATVGSILSRVGQVDDVTAVIVFQNNSSITDIDGRPPHSVDIVVQGGDDTEIAETIFETVAAGIETIGDITEIVNDSQGFAQTIKFSRPTEVPLLLEADLTTNSQFPADGEDQVQANFKAAIDALTIGDDVITIPRLLCAVNGDSELGIDRVPGIVDIELRISKSPTAPTLDDNIVIEPREIASIQLSDITVAVI